jgi:hypothetical protein
MTTDSASPKQGFFQRNKLWFIALALFAISNSGIYFYQRHEQSKLREECRKMLDAKAQMAQENSIDRNEEMAINLSRTLVWGIRGEMERGNKETIELFMNRLVQESGLDLIIVQDAQDSIYLSTDKKFENRRVPYIQGVISQQQVLKKDMEEVVVAAPIMGLEQRLGTCLLVYKPIGSDLRFLEEMKAGLLPGEEDAKGSTQAP